LAFLDPTAIGKLESLAVKARVIVEGALTGMHRAKLRGSSVEFAEHKEYSQGDEIRHIDWKVLGKADRYYIKQFEQESELTCHLVLDASSSMNYVGKGLSKREYACNLIAGLAYLLVKQRDRVGLSVFGNSQLDRYIPPRAKTAHLRSLLSILEKVSEAEQVGDESAASALERVAELARKRRGLVVLATDLFEREGSALEVLRHMRARGHDTVLFHVLDRDEIEFPFDGLSIFESLESEDKMLVDPASIRKIYRERMQSFLQQTEAECRRSGIEYHLVPTDQPFELSLMQFLAARLGVAGAGGNKAAAR
jgi:uncharacterized protein (DUF58 family)